MKKAIAYDKVLFFEDDPIIHRNLGYSAVIKKVLSRGNAIILIPNTPQNKAIWEGSKLPMIIKAQNIIKHFKHDIYTLNL